MWMSLAQHKDILFRPFGERRSPALTGEIIIWQNNLFHTFINATTSYGTIHPNLDDGAEDERAIYGNVLKDHYYRSIRTLLGAITLAKTNRPMLIRKPTVLLPL